MDNQIKEGPLPFYSHQLYNVLLANAMSVLRFTPDWSGTSQDNSDFLRAQSVIKFTEEALKNRKYLDISLHFTIRDQELEILKKKFFFYENEKFNLRERAEGEPDLVLHHCFMPPEIVRAKGFSMDVLDFLDSVADETVCWYQTGSSVNDSRLKMLRNLKRLDGCALFLGEIKDGVAEEFRLIQELGIPYFLIN